MGKPDRPSAPAEPPAGSSIIEESPYNPLDYAVLARNCAEELLRRPPFRLPLTQGFSGAGIYALFYHGPHPSYVSLRSEVTQLPIYVGKAIPPGGRKGNASGGTCTALFDRLTDHTRSLEAAENLDVSDFSCRYLVVESLWIPVAERFLIEVYQPAWNVCLEGFGNHDPGSGRYAGEITWWDAMHHGRSWAKKLRPTKTQEEAQARLDAFFSR